MIVETVLTVALMSALMLTTHGQDVNELTAQLNELKRTVGHLARQTIHQQFSDEERKRTTGDTGIMITRSGRFGPENYYGVSHTGFAFCSIHDHSNYARTVGMGEFTAVLNGVQFQTRHNDYKLVMPSPTSTEYHATVPIPFPGVPKEVTELDDINEQMEEMRQWFKAFQEQNHTVRDYRNYFKPIMCYLEGTWTTPEGDLIDEPFDSDRHHIDAQSWADLLEKVRYTAYTGAKSRLENLATLPTRIMNYISDIPELAQWNYRIVCSPIQEDIPLKYFRQMEDLSYRMSRKMSKVEAFFSRAARFKLYDLDVDKHQKYGVLDKIFSNIYGMDNVPGELRQVNFGETMLSYEKDEELNTGYYNRWFKFDKPGAMGLTEVSRGFNDESLFVAQTTQKRVAPLKQRVCQDDGECEIVEHRFIYAIPMEVIYLTPVLSWNPLDLQQHTERKVATAGGRNGNEDNPLDGVDDANHYLTPISFFSGRTDMSDPADTVRDSIYVLDKNGNKHQTVASGTRIVQQEIAGVGRVRLRYPIAPVHGEGSSVWKEVNAIRDYLFQLQKEGFGSGGGGSVEETVEDLPDVIEFQMMDSNQKPRHTHNLKIGAQDYLDMKNKALTVRVTTSRTNEHKHDLILRYNFKRGFEYAKCDNLNVCADRHPRRLLMIRDAVATTATTTTTAAAAALDNP